MNNSKLARIIAPRLANGRLRVRFGSSMPNPIKEGLRAIARRERKSMSWVVEEVVIDYFSLERPKYVPVAKKRTGK